MKLHLPDRISGLPSCRMEPYPWRKKIGSERDDSVMLASNENPWGPSPKVIQAVSSAMKSMHRYPDMTGEAVVQGIGSLFGVTADEVVLGNGSGEVLELLLRVLVQPGMEVIAGNLSSLPYQRLVDICGGTIVVAELKRLSHDLSDIASRISDRTAVILLDNPNNSTGTAMVPGDLYSFLSEIPESVVVVLDESCVEFMDKERQLDVFSLVRNTKNRCGVAAIRSFSKAYGLAGLRIGYGIMPVELADCLQRIRQPFNVNSLAQAAALAALADQEYLCGIQDRTRRGKEFLREEVKKLGCTSYPSQSNFLLIDVQRNAAGLYEAMKGRGVLVHSMHVYGLSDCIRVSVGTDDENARFVSVLAECLLDLENEKQQ